ncbi:GNAT family N-acetyltransferase [Bacillus sp. EB01]|uniref:GNAT family N-acetyltransferase n=1 Tax=Bacillus sp. EB01 TaxID=1347086 RepID=UPI0005C46B2C|nr:GNAT family N-acetyltransferase [Bacillus sp. EB01]
MEIKKLNREELLEFADITVQAYPANRENTDEYKQKLADTYFKNQEESGNTEYYGLFRDSKLLGGMRLNTFEMNFFGIIVRTGGIGSVAVDLLHKKEKVAKALVEFYLRHFREQGVSYAMLYPFRPDFYKKMGFGYGPKMNQYRITPNSFPLVSKEGLSLLTAGDQEKIKECHNRYAARTHGMIMKTDWDSAAIFKNPDNRVVGAIEGDQLKGYLIFGFEPAASSNFLRNNLVIREMVYETPDALACLATFLHTQSDQIERVIINTQDDALEFMLGDVRNGSGNLIPSVYHESNTAGVGIMYKVLDFDSLISDLEGRNFNGVSTCFSLTVTDSFELNEPRKLGLRFTNGIISTAELQEAEFDIELDIADLSSLFIGAVDARRLYGYGRLRISDSSFFEMVVRAFQSPEKPICMRAF